MDEALRALAAQADVAEGYVGLTGETCLAPPETLRAVLSAMEYDVSGPAVIAEQVKAARAAADRPVPAWVVSCAGRAPDLNLGTAPWTICCEDGAHLEGRGPLPALALGRHRLTVGPWITWVLSAPRALPWPAQGWGLTVPLYGLRGLERGGLGDYADLEAAVRGLAQVGAGFVGINPVHAGFAADRGTISPYSPSHRRRFATMHLNAGAGGGADGRGLIDYAAALEERYGALEQAYGAAGDAADLEAFRAREGAGLERFATYEALAEMHGPRWDAWPYALRAPSAPEVARFAAVRGDRIRFHAWLQYQAEIQLGRVASAAREAGMAQGLYLDLAVGTHPHGAETWAERDGFAFGASLGAPPDAFSKDGQNWSVAPFNPRALVASGFAPLAATLRAQLKFAGMLRIDHILGFERAFWVPDGAPGTYVAMPRDAMLAVVRIEAARAGAVIVGEDLGNIPEGLQGALAASGILGCRVAVFQNGRPAAAYDRDVLTSFGTHDLPTWAGWREGRDIKARQAIGSLPEGDVARALADRAEEVAAIDGVMNGPAGCLDALTAFLAATPSRLVALQAEDLLEVADQANLPGTVDSYPNWRRRLPVGAQALGGDPRVQRAAGIMAAAGR